MAEIKSGITYFVWPKNHMINCINFSLVVTVFDYMKHNCVAHVTATQARYALTDYVFFLYS